MKRFRYRLERVLQFRKAVEAEAKRELQLAQRELADAEGQLSLLEGELVKEFGLVVEGAPMRAEEFFLISSYREGVRARIAAQIVEVERRREVVAERMTQYRKAAQELESLQRHRTTKVTEYDHEVSIAEQAQMDELTVQRHGRRIGL